MLFDADTLRDIEATLSFVEGIVSSQLQALSEEKKAIIKDILANTNHDEVDGDELWIHCGHPLLEQYSGDIKADIPFDRIKTVNLVGDAGKGFYNAVYLEKKVRFLLPSAMAFCSSSSYLHFEAFKQALAARMQEETDSYETLWFGFSYGGDLYTLEYVGENGLDVYCASHPFANASFSPLGISLANMDEPRIEARYITSLSLNGLGMAGLSPFRQGLYESGVEVLLDHCANLKEISIADDCPLKEKIIQWAKERGIKVVG